MTKPLSEQVAELEAEVERLNKRVVWLDDQREYLAGRADGLEEQRDQLKAERDRLEADAISDSIKRNFLEAQVRNREAERDDLQRQVQEARDEDDALPRVIGAEELRVGQTVAVYSDRSGVAAGVVYHLEPDVFRLDPGFHHGRTRYRPWMLSAIRGETIVLLEDAPETIASEDVPFKGMSDLRYKEPEDDFPCCGSRPTGYADDDHQDAEITDWHKPHRVVFQRASEAQ